MVEGLMGHGGSNAEQGAAAAAAAGGPGRILLAEDDASLCRSLTRILAKGGYAVEAVLSGGAARDRIMAQEYDVILSDINMPGMRGPEILRWPGTGPFHGGDLQQIIYAVNHTTPPPLGSLTAGVPEALQQVVMRMIAKAPADRCQGVGEFLAALGQPCECGS